MAPVPPDRWLAGAACADLRSRDVYEESRPAGAVRFEVEDLLHRPYLLPPATRPLVLVGGPQERMRLVVRALQVGGRTGVRHLPGESWRQHLDAETGPPTRTHLWEASAALVEALDQYAPTAPPAGARRGLDLACGAGRNAVHLALRGYDTTAIDILPDALERARDLARRSGAELLTLERDLEKPGVLRDLRADCIVVTRYLERSLFEPIQECLSPGGILVYETFTIDQMEMGHPRNPRFLLQPGELRAGFPALDILSYREGFLDGAHVARLVARCPGESGSADTSAT